MKHAISTVPGLALITLVSGGLLASAAPGITERVSVDSNGAEADHISEMAAISASVTDSRAPPSA